VHLLYRTVRSFVCKHRIIVNISELLVKLVTVGHATQYKHTES